MKLDNLAVESSIRKRLTLDWSVLYLYSSYQFYEVYNILPRDLFTE